MDEHLRPGTAREQAEREYPESAGWEPYHRQTLIEAYVKAVAWAHGKDCKKCGGS